MYRPRISDVRFSERNPRPADPLHPRLAEVAFIAVLVIAAIGALGLVAAAAWPVVAELQAALERIAGA